VWGQRGLTYLAGAVQGHLQEGAQAALHQGFDARGIIILAIMAFQICKES